MFYSENHLAVFVHLLVLIHQLIFMVHLPFLAEQMEGKTC